MIACNFMPDQFKRVPEHLIKEPFLSNYIRSNGLKYVPEKFMNKEVLMIACASSNYSLEYIPEKLITEELCLIACRYNRDSLSYVPEKYVTEKLINSLI